METARTFTPSASPARRHDGLRPLAAFLLAVVLVLNACDVSAQPDRNGPPKLGPPPSLRLRRSFSPPVIPGGATLKFEIKLLSIQSAGQ